MKPFLPLVVALLAGASPALAGDARLVTHVYKTDEVVRIDGRAGVQASIAFAEDEHIENVAIGDSTSWQVTPNRRANMLFVKPLGNAAQTNLTVVTDRRSYYFDLVASPGAHALYALRFQYPDEPGRSLEHGASSQVQGSLALDDRPADPASLNFAWEGKGKRNLLPSRIYDDGTSTYLGWPEGVPVPAVLVRNEKGEEGPVNFAVRGEMIVVDGVPARIILRSGKASATIENKGQPRPPQPTRSAAITAVAAASTD